jgi:hypothetical protein
MKVNPNRKKPYHSRELRRELKASGWKPVSVKKSGRAVS